MSELIRHDCPVEGEIMIEKGKPCNWCDELDKPPIVRLVPRGPQPAAIRSNKTWNSRKLFTIATG